MGAIYRGPTRGYELTDTDVLWLARGFVGEAGSVTREEAGALFHCWMDRFLLLNMVWLKNKWPFYKFLQSHSQPINPLWTDPNGAKCTKYPKYCTDAHISRRKRIQSLTIKQLTDQGAYQFAKAAQQGDLQRAISEPTYDFAACSLTRKQGRPNEGINLGGNCFLPYSSLKDNEKQAVIDVNARVEIAGSSNTLLKGAILAGLTIIIAWKLFFD